MNIIRSDIFDAKLCFKRLSHKSMIHVSDEIKVRLLAQLNIKSLDLKNESIDMCQKMEHVSCVLHEM